MSDSNHSGAEARSEHKARESLVPPTRLSEFEPSAEPVPELERWVKGGGASRNTGSVPEDDARSVLRTTSARNRVCSLRECGARCGGSDPEDGRAGPRFGCSPTRGGTPPHKRVNDCRTSNDTVVCFQHFAGPHLAGCTTGFGWYCHTILARDQ